jgi:hypothetical protein
MVNIVFGNKGQTILTVHLCGCDPNSFKTLLKNLSRTLWVQARPPTDGDKVQTSEVATSSA